MNATYTIQARPRQTRETEIRVLPTAERYVYQMESCHQLAYGYTPSPDDVEALTADKFRQHLRLFPEGQFMALDAEIIVGTSTNMRLDVDLHQHSPKSWAEVTNDG